MMFYITGDLDRGETGDMLKATNPFENIVDLFNTSKIEQCP